MAIRDRSERPSLPVHLRRIASGSGRERTSAVVACPPRDATVSRTLCARCAAGGGARASDRQPCDHAPVDSSRPRPSAELLAELEATPVGALMSREVVCAAPDLRIDALAELLEARAISGVPVVDERGRPVGVVSRADLVAASIAPGRGATQVSEIMMPFSFSVPERAVLAHAIALMACEGVHRLPVVGGTARSSAS
jgi:hypothetical protein